MLSDEQMSNGWSFSLLNDEQMSNKVRVEHQPDIQDIYTLVSRIDGDRGGELKRGGHS